MLAILIEILTEIPLQKQHIMRQLKAQNKKDSIYKRQYKKLQAANKAKDSCGDSFKYGDLELLLIMQYA